LSFVVHHSTFIIESMDVVTFSLVGSVLALLCTATGAGYVLKRQSATGLDPAMIEQFNRRVRAWWLLCAALAAAFLLGSVATMVLFGVLSFWALREFITLTPTRAADHRTLFWVILAFTPLQYILVASNKYELYSIMIPVYGFLFVPARIALAGDYKRYLERCAKIQSGMMICVYCLSHAPALLKLPLKLPSGEQYDNTRLLFFFMLVVVAGDAFSYACEKLIGKHPIAPAINPNRTWEGFFGGVACATLFGTALKWATPFNYLEAAGMSLAITTMGFAGGLTMSAIKRDRGVKDYGTLVEGHGGVLDRIDSICFAAPVFFHFTRYFFT
jgi:phosphatidate cytidylyltransferase